jgi:nitroimidazol reductase NimA-like FMN-containing flavoprotein (pyridoxamine 5'-phosphate oxidase superfamily)
VDDPETKSRIAGTLAQPLLARLATASPDNLQPHAVPVWFYWDGDSLWISAFSSTRKVKELQRNPRCAVVIDGGGPPEEDSTAWGVLMEGAARLVTQPRDFVAEMSYRIYSRYMGEEGVQAPEPQSWMRDPGNTLIQLTPQLLRSWGI